MVGVVDNILYLKFFTNLDKTAYISKEIAIILFHPN